MEDLTPRLQNYCAILRPETYHRIIKVARTIADMDLSHEIKPEHMAEAVQYRVLDRQLDKGIIGI